MTIQLTVPGMACSTCANNITNAVKSVDAYAIVRTDLQTKVISVETQALETAVQEALVAAGYPPTEISTSGLGE